MAETALPDTAEPLATSPGERLRKIIHVDMDAFYAAIEQRDDPTLRGRPIAVGGSGPRGVVMTASYEARAYGVRSAMPTARARRLCPDLIVVRARFDAYKAASAVIREVMLGWTSLVEPLALDEAYLDVTEAAAGEALPAVEIARRIKAEIQARTGLTASAGVAACKFLAKIASDLDKPDGLTVIRPRAADAFLAQLPIERFHGVGPATAARLRRLGIITGADLRACDPLLLQRHLGRFGLGLRQLAHGIDRREVRPDRLRKSLGIEETLDEDLADADAMVAVLGTLATELARRLQRSGFTGRTLTLKLKTDDFRIRTRSLTLAELPVDSAGLLAIADRLLRRSGLPARPVRLLGLTVGGADRGWPADRQLSLLAQPPSEAAGPDQNGPAST